MDGLSAFPLSFPLTNNLFFCFFFSLLPVLFLFSPGFLGLREGPVQPRAPSVLHLCCSQPQKKEIKGEAAA